MNSNKRVVIIVLLYSIAAVAAFTLTLDLSRLYSLENLYSKYPVEPMKRSIVVLAAAIVWLAGRNSLSLQDNRKMKIVFIIISIGEILFMTGQPALAIVCFAACQCLLVTRHSEGLFAGISKASLVLRFKLALYAFIILILLLFGTTLLYSLAETNSSIIAFGIIYGIILSLSLWAGAACCLLKLLPPSSSKMIAIGMLCFYCCDVLVALDGLLQSGTAWLLASSLIWVFYTPALVLLALSCYRYS